MYCVQPYVNRLITPSFDTYKDLVEKFTIRKLSKQSDVINAITGVSNSAYGPTWENPFAYRLPMENFEDTLQWQPNELYGLQEFMPQLYNVYNKTG